MGKKELCIYKRIKMKKRGTITTRIIKVIITFP